MLIDFIFSLNRVNDPEATSSKQRRTREKPCRYRKPTSQNTNYLKYKGLDYTAG